MEKSVQLLPIKDIKELSDAFAKSGMFTDAKQAVQAFVKIQAGQEIGIPPFAVMSGIHIIQGKPTLGAGLIASTVKGSGKYDYKVVKMDEKICSIDFFQGVDKIGNSTFTIEEAKKAGTKNLDKFPKNMLFARAISNGVKWFCPDVFSGPVYVPEEMPEPVTEDIEHEEVNEIDFEDALNNCNSLNEIKEVWGKMSVAERKKFNKLKDKLKAKFETNE